MNLNSLTSKLTSKADTLGKLYGYLAPMVSVGKERYGEGALNAIFNRHQEALNAIMQGKLPKLENIMIAIQDPGIGMNVIKNGLIAYILGEIGGGFIGGKNASALKKFGMETMKYAALSSALITWDWNPHPPAGIGSHSAVARATNNGYGY